MKITDFSIYDGRGNEVPGDTFGNNVAFECPQCCHPILAIARKDQRGSSEENPARCRGCGARYVLYVPSGSRKLYVYQLPAQ